MDFEDIRTLEDMLACRDAFLGEPGCDVDLDGILSEMGDWNGPDDGGAIAREWFDRVAAMFMGQAEIEVYRHMTVPDFAMFAASLEEGPATVGAHWSLSEETWSPSPEQSSEDVLMAGVLAADQVDWFTTFQNFFAHPWEQEVAFEDEVQVLWVRDVETGERRLIERPCRPFAP